MSDSTEPLEGYDALNVNEVVARLEGLGDDDVARVQAYEADHKDRQTIVGWERPAPPEPDQQDSSEPFQPEGAGPLREVAEKAAAAEVVHTNPTQEEK